MHYFKSKVAVYLISAVTVPLVLTTEAWGQERQGAAAAAQPANAVGEVIVTAQRREERLRDVPLSVTALSSDELTRQRINSVSDLTTVVPGLVLGAEGTTVQPAIRGVSTKLGIPGAESNIAIYLDGVYQFLPAATNFELADIQRVEVLKGPQGTLFGRNAAGGAISIITRDPSFTPTGDVEAGYGSFEEFRARGFVSFPVSDKVAVSLSGLYSDNNGWTRDLIRGGHSGDQSSALVRGKILFKPTDRLQFMLTGFHIERSDDAQFNFQPYKGRTRNNTNIPTPTRPHDAAVDIAPYIDTTISGGVLRAEYDFDDLNLTSLTSYTKVRTHGRSDSDGGPQPTTDLESNQPGHAFQQEFQLASSFDGPFNFIAGLFYMDSKHAFDPVLSRNSATGVTTFTIQSEVNTTAYAAFGEATYDVTDQLSLIAGLRYSWEEKTLNGAFSLARPIPRLGKKSWDAVTPRFSIKYALNPESNVYFTYSKGFKSGVFDSSGLRPTPIEPETLSAFEVGVKSRVTAWLDVSAAAYHYIYKNQQVQVVVSPAPGVFVTSLQNAEEAKANGFELDAAVQVSPEFSLRASVSWLDTEYTDFPNAAALIWSGTANVTTLIDAKGKSLIRSPNWTLSGTAAYKVPLGDGTLDASVSVYYSDNYWFEVANLFGQDAYTMVDAQVTYTFSNGVRVGVWGKNLADEVVALSTFQSAVADRIAYQAPRSYGVRVGYSF